MAATSGLSPDLPDAQVRIMSGSPVGSAHAKGQFGGALRFDGGFYAQAESTRPRLIASGIISEG